MKKLLFLFILLPLKVFAGAGMIPGTSIVYDPTNEKNSLIQIENMARSIEYNKQMAEQIGKGEFTPGVINYVDNLYSKCGGKKYGLPDFFPKPNLQICSDEKKLIDTSLNYYRDNVLTLSFDTPEIAKKKQIKRRDDAIRIRSYALSRSVIDMEKAKTNTDTIKNLNKAIKSSKTQMDILKIQLQVQVMMLEQLQTLNERQALLIHMNAVKE